MALQQEGEAMTEDEFQRDIEQPARRFLDSHMKMLAGCMGATALGAIAAAPGDKHEKHVAMAREWQRVHEAYGVEPPWDALPEEIRAHRPH